MHTKKIGFPNKSHGISYLLGTDNVIHKGIHKIPFLCAQKW